MADIPSWNVSGDWFDVCSCSVPCPCIFAQAPTNGECEGVLAYHIRKGRYGDTPLDCMNALFLSYFKGKHLGRRGKSDYWVIFRRARR